MSKFLFWLSIIFSVYSYAGDKVAQSLLVNEQGVVFIDVARGLVKIQGWNKAEVLIQGELDDTANQLIFKNKNMKTLIKMEAKGQQHWGDSSVFKIFMPTQSTLRFKGIDTTFSVANIDGNIEGKTLNGHLMIEHSRQTLDISTVSGNVKVVNSSGVANIESVSGGVDFSGQFSAAFIKSMSGNIFADISGTSHLTVKNISGDTRLTGIVGDKALIKLFSVSGNVLYQAPEELNAACDIASQFGGTISNHFSDDLPQSSILQKQQLSFVSGNGSGKLIINTVSGAVNIEKSVD